MGRCFIPAFLWVAIAIASPAWAGHDAVFWRSIVANKYAVPKGESAELLSGELSQLLGSPDPELRDDLAYSILARWIARPGFLSTARLNALTDEWRANLGRSAAPGELHPVLRRSFSALCLASMARREVQDPFMGADRYHALLRDALAYLRDETDLRGWDARLGWIHATAHTSDLLEALADHPQLSKDESEAILAAIGRRLSTAGYVYTQGEQDRMAAAIRSVIRRRDFEAPVFEKWLAGVQAEDAAVWEKPLTEESLATYQNHTYTLQALAVRLALEPDSPAILSFRTQILALLRTR